MCQPGSALDGGKKPSRRPLLGVSSVRRPNGLPGWLTGLASGPFVAIIDYPRPRGPPFPVLLLRRGGRARIMDTHMAEMERTSGLVLLRRRAQANKGERTAAAVLSSICSQAEEGEGAHARAGSHPPTVGQGADLKLHLASSSRASFRFSSRGGILEPTPRKAPSRTCRSETNAPTAEERRTSLMRGLPKKDQGHKKRGACHGIT